MAKAKRSRRAKNNVNGAVQGELITTKPAVETVVDVPRSHGVRIARATLFSAEFEAVTEIIAKDRVYRQMRAGLRPRLLIPPPTNSEVLDA